MKTDRFVKVMLVIIAGLLLLNFFKDNNGGGSIFGVTKVEASVPTFFQVGKSYTCSTSAQPDQSMSSSPSPNMKIIRIDSNGGWIESENRWGKFWFNTAQLGACLDSTQNSSNK